MATETCERKKVTAAPAAGPAGRRLPEFLKAEARAAGATAHLLFETAGAEGDSCRILTCNWIYDAVAETGLEAVASLAQSRAASLPGVAARGFHPLALAAMTGRGEIAALADYGHQEIFVLLLPAGRASHCLVLSASQPGRIEKAALPRLQMACCYAASRFSPVAEAVEGNPLSRRELECLSWVSQGKTADEIAVILGVSANTVNSQVALAIHKLKARNRAMAIATAIRRKLI